MTDKPDSSSRVISLGDLLRINPKPPACLVEPGLPQQGILFCGGEETEGACLFFLDNDLCNVGFGGEVSLAWDPSISTNIVGYKVYVGLTPRTYGRADHYREPNDLHYDGPRDGRLVLCGDGIRRRRERKRFLE